MKLRAGSEEGFPIRCKAYDVYIFQRLIYIGPLYFYLAFGFRKGCFPNQLLLNLRCVLYLDLMLALGIVRWKFFLKTIKDNTLEFSFVITEIQTFLEPVFDAIVNEKEWQEQWNFIMKWNKNERSPKL